MSKPYTVMIQVEASSPENGAALDNAFKAAQSRLKGSKGLISTEAYRCQEGARYLNILKWDSEASHQAYHQAVGDDCPVGKLIQEGKAQFKFGPVDAVN